MLQVARLKKGHTIFDILAWNDFIQSLFDDKVAEYSGKIFYQYIIAFNEIKKLICAHHSYCTQGLILSKGTVIPLNLVEGSTKLTQLVNYEIIAVDQSQIMRRKDCDLLDKSMWICIVQL